MSCCSPAVPSAQVAPLWKDDASRSSCAECSRSFHWMFRRRHHCRFCGDIFCWSCASWMAPLDVSARHGYGRTSQRMCYACYATLVENWETTSNAVREWIDVLNSSVPSTIVIMEEGPERLDATGERYSPVISTSSFSDFMEYDKLLSASEVGRGGLGGAAPVTTTTTPSKLLT